MTLDIQHLSECNVERFYNEGDSLSDYSSIIGDAMNSLSNEKENFKDIYILFANVFSMALNPEGLNEVFLPKIAFDGKRSAMQSDYNEEELEFLSQALDTFSEPRIVSRIADLLWLEHKPRDVKYAQLAIYGYTSIPIRDDAWDYEIKAFYNRAYRLSMTIGNKECQDHVSKKLFDAFEKQERLSHDISLLILELGILRQQPEKLTAFTGSICTKAIEAYSKQLYKLAQTYFEIAANLFHLKKDNEKEHEMIFRWSQAIEKEAQIYFESGDHHYSHQLFGKAIQSFRRVPKKFRKKNKVDEIIAELQLRKIEAGKIIVSELQPISLPKDLEDSVGLDEVAKMATESINSASSLENAIYRLTMICQKPNLELIKQETIDRCKKDFLTSLFGSTHFSTDGRIEAQTESYFPPNDGKASVVDQKMFNSFKFNVEIYTKYLIYPALQQIARDYSVSKHTVRSLTYFSPIVPGENHFLISDALWLGFEFEFSKAIHLIAPQMECILRNQLKKSGLYTCHYDSNHIETEIGMSSLLDLPEAQKIFGEDFLFELKTIFTEPTGFNLRNNVAHGLLTDYSCGSPGVVYAWWVMLRMICESYHQTERN